MNEKNTKILFYGALWGGIEATLGYLMHLLLVPYTGFVMFPIGAYFMRRGMIETEDKRSPIYIALVAAAIKCADFFMPNVLAIKVINPAIAILLQGVAVTIFITAINKDVFVKAFSASIGWRLCFIALVLIESLSGAEMRLLSTGILGIARYLVVDSFVNAVLIYALVKGVPYKRITVKPAFALMTLMIALAVNVAL
ncbi:MAG: hypothetical protein JXO44_00525 [Clostridia bacterium]|nr:hypothetical protein [Clostridia bacterium]